MTQGEQHPNPAESQAAPAAATESSHAAQGAQAEAAAGLQQEGVETGDALIIQLAEAQAKLTEMQDAYLRAKAEADNTRRRAQEDIAKALRSPISRR